VAEILLAGEERPFHMPKKAELSKSKGTLMAEETRAKGNRLSHEERHRLMGKALERIYKSGHGKVSAGRR
jgi:hypothetical protein